jgi:hypothetical protein
MILVNRPVVFHDVDIWIKIVTKQDAMIDLLYSSIFYDYVILGFRVKQLKHSRVICYFSNTNQWVIV